MPESGVLSPGPGEAAPAAVERRLSFDLASGAYSIRLDAISGVMEMSSWRKVPGAPAGVLGLAEWRGRPLTVLDLPYLLREREGNGIPSLVRLAPPFDHLALYVPASLRLEELPGTREPDEGSRGSEPRESARLLDPKALVEAVIAAGTARDVPEREAVRADPKASG